MSDRSTVKALLDRARDLWRDGEWSALVALTADDFSDNSDRARLALLAADGYQRTGDTDAAERYARLALRWGCSRQLVTRVLVSAAHDSLAVAAAAQGDVDAMLANFVEASRLSGDRKPESAGRMRGIRELTRAGLLAQAMHLLTTEVTQARSQVELRQVSDSRMTMLETQLELLQGELSLAQQRGLMSATHATASERGLESRATSQLGQDVWVLERTGYKREGFFVEFGATDGVLLSNTYLLEQGFDWTGVCAEPNPKLFAQLQRNRRCTVSNACIAGESGKQVEFILADAYGGIADYAAEDSHAAKREAFRRNGAVTTMTTVSLNDFLMDHAAPRRFDYLSIDTEGSEFEILQAFPLHAWTIDLITVEHNYSARRDGIRELLAARGYIRIERDWDDWYYLPH